MMTSRDIDALFQALAHEARRRMLDIVEEEPGIGVGALASEFDV
jgi:DNA-binding transcriptional ArsR family regulator